MFIPKSALFFVILLAILLEPISGWRKSGGGHSYPKSGGLSGGGHHSGGLSGGGQGYPSSGGSHAMSSGGAQAHGYPSSGGNHGYPSSGGSSGSHGYPSSGGNSGSHGYPSSGGLSGSGHGYPNSGQHTTNNPYRYSPPHQIRYTPVRGGPPVMYPVYHGTPPNYVYEYKNSGSKYGTLLAGLALLNLGTLAGAAYAHTRGSSGAHYKAEPGEVCKFAIKKANGDYEETKIDCQIISSFILQDQAQRRNADSNTTVSIITVTNTTVVNSTNMMPDQAWTPGPAVTTPGPVVTPGSVVPSLGNVLYAMLPNGTLVPVNMTSHESPVNMTQNVTGVTSPPNSTVVNSSVMTTITTNTTLVNALDVKGKPVEVTSGMKCFVIRQSSISNMRKTVPCDLIQKYADRSITRNSAARNGPMFTILAAIIAFCVAY